MMASAVGFRIVGIDPEQGDLGVGAPAFAIYFKNR
jgi:hypothetical protein